VVFTVFSLVQEKEKLVQNLDQQLRDAALLTPLLLPKSLHHNKMIKEDLTRSDSYNNILSLSEFTDHSDINYIYTLILRDEKVYFTSSSATQEERLADKGLSNYFDSYYDVDPGVYDVFDNKQESFLEYTDQWGSFRSVFIPAHSIDGTFYLIGADISISHINSLLYKHIYQSLIVGILFLLFIYPMYLAATYRIKSITKRLNRKVKSQTDELYQKEKRLNFALKSAQQSWFDHNLITGELDISDELPKILKYTHPSFKMDLSIWRKNIYHDDLFKVKNVLNECIKNDGPATVEYRLQTLDGSCLWVHSVAEIIEWDINNNPSRMVGIHRNITRQKQSDDVLRFLAETGTTEEGNIFKSIVRQLALSQNVRYAFIACLNPHDNTQADTIALWANGEIADNFSYMLTATACSTVFELNGGSICFYPNNVQKSFPEDHLLTEMEAESYIGVPLVNSVGKTIGIICIVDDKPMASDQITFDLLKSLTVRANIELECKESKEKLEMMAHYDLLTQLPNRTLFADRFNQAVAHSKRSKTMIAICFLDLDHFKPVNDNHGHDVGDKLLIEVANRIKSTIREEDSVSRQGGDEFTLLLRDIETPLQCEKMLQRVSHVLAQPYIINGFSLRITASIGFTICPIGNSDLDSLIREADQAMYQAKLSGGNKYYSSNIFNGQKISNQQSFLLEIRQALVNNQFQLHYQPKVDMITGKVFGVEALIRWLHPQKGLIPPLDFLPAIAGTDLELQVGGWVINEALSQLHAWQENGLPLQVSINISSHHIQSNVFFKQLNDAFEEYSDVNPQHLQLEILESSALGDINTISSIINKCQNELNVCFALDDFGTGYSSLTHIKNLPAKTIKIDQTFVNGLLDDPNDYSIIKGIIGLAKAFNREIIAEGVETVPHGLMLINMGCSQAQGYVISKPLSAESVPSWIAAYKPNLIWASYQRNKFSSQESNIWLLCLTIEHWYNNVNALLLSTNSHDEYPLTECQFDTWLLRIEENKFNEDWLKQLKQIHKFMFDLSCELISLHQRGQFSKVQTRIHEFNNSYDGVNSHLKNTH
jgi:diguanylate cyclase (GGDEF)-like protein